MEHPDPPLLQYFSSCALLIRHSSGGINMHRGPSAVGLYMGQRMALNPEGIKAL
jgi:hypothetical protein